MAGKQRMVGLQILRLVAAALVLLPHARHYADMPYAIIDEAFASLKLGRTGVFIFFVISGYVIATQINAHPARFAMHRLLRIYPAHFGALLIGGLLAVSVGAVAIGDIEFKPSLLLLPTGRLTNWSFVPYWTLVFEMYFYTVVFLFLLAGKRWFDTLLIVWAFLILAYAIAVPEAGTFSPRLSNVAPSLWSMLFIVGAALARAHAGNTRPLAAICAAALATVYLRLSMPYLATVLAAAGATIAIIHLSVHADGWLARQSWARYLARGGDWSYGLYLLHLPVIVVVCTILPALGAPWSVTLTAALLAGGGTGLLYGCLEHRAYVEYLRPLADRLARSLQPGTPPADETASVAQRA